MDYIFNKDEIGGLFSALRDVSPAEKDFEEIYMSDFVRKMCDELQKEERRRGNRINKGI